MFTVNNYDDAHSHAYKILNMVVDMLGEHATLVALLRWEWVPVPDKYCMEFRVKYKDNYYAVTKQDRDMFDAEWYQSCAEELTAWLLLQKNSLKTG